MAESEKPFHAFIAPDIDPSNIDLESSHDNINDSIGNHSISTDFLIQTAQSNYPSIRKPPPPPPFKQKPKPPPSKTDEKSDSKEKQQIPKKVKRTTISSSALNLLSSAKKSISTGARSVSSKTAERISLEGQLRQARISLEKYLNPKIVNTELNVDKGIPQWVLKGAKGIVFLTVIKAGFILAGSVGTGCVIVKRKDGSWSGPSSVGVAGIGAGLLVGASKVDYIMILPNDNAVKQFTGKGQLRLGGELQLAVGPLGRDASGSVGTGDKKRFSIVYSYSHAAGLYGGLGLDGKIISVRPRCNEEFYGEKLSVKDILIEKLDPNDIQNEDYELITHLLDAYCIGYNDDDEKSNQLHAVFGRNIKDLECTKMKQYKSEIPNILQTFKDVLYIYEGHLVQGIFRVPPKQTDLNALRDIIDNGRVSDIDFEVIDPGIIAQLIKTWYRELPVKILDNIDCEQIEKVETVSDAQDLMDTMKEPWLSYLYWLLDLCIDIGNYADINLMSANNMAVVVAPCLYDIGKVQSVTISTSVVHFVSLCIELRIEMMHLDDANKIMDDTFEHDESNNDQIPAPSKPEISL